MTKIGVWEQMILVVPMLVLLLLNTPSQARPRRRFCENYPFARRCLGVAAKRSISKSDIYSTLIQKVLDDNRESFALHNDDSLTDKRSSSTISKLISALITNDNKDSFLDSSSSWEDLFSDYDNYGRV